MDMIEIEHLTKDYGGGRGVFDVSFSVKKGEVMGFLGPNGAGKTTTIRHLMGFVRPEQGRLSIHGMDCFRDAAKIQQKLGYLPGEIAFMEDMTGTQFLKFIGRMKGVREFKRRDELIERFELNPEGRIKKMSKGMKQKIGIICAFMQEPDILILDEPTSGLDPLMQNLFVELIQEEKEKGTTILMSSHMFEEVERTCDRTAIIKEGHLAAVEDMAALKGSRYKTYRVAFKDAKTAESFEAEGAKIKERENNRITVKVKGDIMPFIKALGHYEVTGLDVVEQTLEDLFMHYYGGKGE